MESLSGKKYRWKRSLNGRLHYAAYTIHRQGHLGAEDHAAPKKVLDLVNISRGGLIDELALVDALNSGQVSFAALDVFDNEPTPREEILKHPKISLTPHIGAATNEAQERIGVELANLIIQHFKWAPK